MHHLSPPRDCAPSGSRIHWCLAEQGWVGSGNSSQDKKEASAQADFKNIIKDSESRTCL